MTAASPLPGATRVAAIQMLSGDSVEDNLRTARLWLAEARERGCGLALLPENFAYIGQRDSDKLALAETDGAGPIQEWLAATAAELSMWIVAGSLPLKAPQTSLCFGACYVFDAAGKAAGCYRKIHLFDVDVPGRNERYRESESMDPGHEPLAVDSPPGRLGLSICYDLRFPELYRRLVDAGATILTVPAAFTFATGEAHWHTLLRARAIENLAYVIAAGQHGKHPNGRTTFGHSLIVDPWGRILGEQADGDGLVTADLDPALPGRLRAEFPVLEHRRL
jgi:deaminated glutathione amidase